MRRLAALVVALALVVTTTTVAPPLRALASPVATDDTTYQLYGRVFPDPHGCVKGQPGKSPFAQGNVCATQFIQFPELIAGLRFLESKFPQLLEVYAVAGQSAGLPTTTLERRKHALYAVRVTDERLSAPKKKFAFSLSIHGIERAGAEGGTRAIEDLVTWGTQDPNRPLLETVADSAVTVGQALAQSELWFFYPNPDGWVRGDVTSLGAMYQRYNGNGVDPNRDWPTSGYTFRPYTPASEPETVAFGDFLKAQGTGWAGSGDLHGMLEAIAFTFTMLPAGEYDYARNAAVVSTVRRIQEDAFPRLRWFPIIRPYSQTPSITRPWAQQWGTVWDTIGYTMTGGLGDWMGNPIGLDAYVGIDNEMWFSHIAPNNAFEPDLEQAHIDGNKGLIYAQIESAFRIAPRTFPLNGGRGAQIAYVDHGRVFSHPGSPSIDNPYAHLPPQQDQTTELTSPTASGSTSPTHEFDLLGPEQGIYSGGFTVQVTYTNAQGVSPADLVTGVHVERFECTDEDCSSRGWVVYNSHFNQNQLYAAAGHTVNVNAPPPGRWRVRLADAPPGVHRVAIDFASGPAWPDPGQVPYSATSVKFFADLDRYLPAGQKTTRLTPADILAGADLSRFDTLVLVNDPLPGWYDPQPAGSAQPDESFTVLGPAVPAEESQVIHEFDQRPEFNTGGITISVTWDVISDYDLYLERQTPSGAWVEIGRAINFVNFGETIAVAGTFPGHYRLRIVNFAAVAQPLRVLIDFQETGLQPPSYPVTRTVAERDAYYARLKVFVEGGGNLVLTDGAARALPHLGVGEPGNVKAQRVFAPYIGFTTNGSDSTYGDPLARNVNQPGAAEGPGRRHQTVEPVPLGYAIQSANGDLLGHSFTWTVLPDAWTAAGGRVAGTTGAAVSLGEIPLGQGRIRFVGGLLPDAEVRDPAGQKDVRPFGLANYALTYTGWQLLENLAQWERPLPDLALASSDIALSTARVVGGDNVTVTATVRNAGTAEARNVAVRFAVDGQAIAPDQTIASIPAGGSGTASVVWSVKHQDGTHTLTVTADPADAIRELVETNNAASVSVTVRGNKVRNGSFEQSATGTSPDNWSSSGGTTYAQGGTHGSRSVTADATGSWTSDAIAVTAGKTYGVAVDVSGGSIVIEQLSALGAVLATLTNVTSFTVAADVAEVRVKLTGGGLTGVATFDNVRLWEE